MARMEMDYNNYGQTRSCQITLTSLILLSLTLLTSIPLQLEHGAW